MRTMTTLGAALALVLSLPSMSSAQVAKPSGSPEKASQSTPDAKTQAPKATAGKASGAKIAPAKTSAAKPEADKAPAETAKADAPKEEAATASAANDSAPDATPAAKPRLLMAAAGHYADFQGEVSRIRDKPFSDAKSVESALNTFGAQNAGQLASGWIAYAAMLASRNPEFIKGVKQAEEYYKHDEFVKILQENPGYARVLPGGEQALQQALAANSKDSARFTNAAQFVAEQSRKLTTVSWGKKAVANRSATAANLAASAKKEHRVTEAAQKLLAANDLDAMLSSATSANEPASVWDKVSVLAVSAPVSAISALTPTMTATATSLKVKPARQDTANRIVTLAALHIIDADVQNSTVVEKALLDKTSVACIEAAQLQIQACVSTANTPAAQSFCLARHGIGVVEDNQQSIGRCLGAVTE